MKIIIMGCGRVGAQLASMLDKNGHEVTVLDIDPAAFRFLPADFGGHRLVGNGIDMDVLRKAGIEQADAFVSATRGDNRNVMAAQIAKHIFQVPRVVSRIFDPLREEIYHELGLRTISPTRISAMLLKEVIEAEEPEEGQALARDESSAAPGRKA